MKRKFKEKVVCPYCGTVSMIAINPKGFRSGDTTFYCDPELEAEGCGKTFVVEWNLSIKVSAYPIQYGEETKCKQTF